MNTYVPPLRRACGVENCTNVAALGLPFCHQCTEEIDALERDLDPVKPQRANRFWTVLGFVILAFVGYMIVSCIKGFVR